MYYVHVVYAHYNVCAHTDIIIHTLYVRIICVVYMSTRELLKDNVNICCVNILIIPLTMGYA